MSFTEDTISQSSATSFRLHQLKKSRSAKSCNNLNLAFNRQHHLEADDRFKPRQRSGAGGARPNLSQPVSKQPRLTLNGIPPDFASANSIETNPSSGLNRKMRLNTSPIFNSPSSRDVSKEQSNVQNRNVFTFSKYCAGRKSEPTTTSKTESQLQGRTDRSNKKGTQPGLWKMRKPSKQLSPLSEGHPPVASAGVTFDESAKWAVNDFLQTERSPSKKLKRFLQSEVDMEPKTTANARESPESGVLKLLDPECCSLDCGNPRYTTPEKFCTLCRSDKSQTEDPNTTRAPSTLSQPKARRRESDDLILRASGERRVSFAQPASNLSPSEIGATSPGEVNETVSKVRCGPIPKRMEDILEKLKRSGFPGGRFSPTSLLSETKKAEDKAAFSDEDKETFLTRTRARFKPIDFECWKSLKEHAPRCVSPIRHKTNQNPVEERDLSEKSLPALRAAAHSQNSVSDDVKPNNRKLSVPESRNAKEPDKEKHEVESRGKTTPVPFLHFLPKGAFFNRKGRICQNKCLPLPNSRKPNKEEQPHITGNSQLNHTESQIYHNELRRPDELRDLTSSLWDEQKVGEDLETHSNPPSADTINSVLDGTVTVAKQSVSQPIIEDYKTQTVENAQMIFRPCISGPETAQTFTSTKQEEKQTKGHELSQNQPQEKHKNDLSRMLASLSEPTTRDDWMNDLLDELNTSRGRIRKDTNVSKDIDQLKESLASIRDELKDRQLNQNIDRVVDKLRRNALQLVELEQEFRLARLQNTYKKRNKSTGDRRKTKKSVTPSTIQNLTTSKEPVLQTDADEEERYEEEPKILGNDKISDVTTHADDLYHQSQPKELSSSTGVKDNQIALQINDQKTEALETEGQVRRILRQPRCSVPVVNPSITMKVEPKKEVKISNVEHEIMKSKPIMVAEVCDKQQIQLKNLDKIDAFLGLSAPVTSTSRARSFVINKSDLINLMESLGKRRHSIAEIPPGDVVNQTPLSLDGSIKFMVPSENSVEPKSNEKESTVDMRPIMPAHKPASTVLAEAKVVPCPFTRPSEMTATKQVQNKQMSQFTPIERSEPILNEHMAILPVKSSEGYGTDSLTNVADQRIIPREVQSDDGGIILNDQSLPSIGAEFDSIVKPINVMNRSPTNASTHLDADGLKSIMELQNESDFHRPPKVSRSYHKEVNTGLESTILISRDSTKFLGHKPSDNMELEYCKPLDKNTGTLIDLNEVTVEVIAQNKDSFDENSAESLRRVSTGSISLPLPAPDPKTLVGRSFSKEQIRPQTVPLTTGNYKTGYSEEISELGIEQPQHKLPSIIKSGNYEAKSSILTQGSIFKPNECSGKLPATSNTPMQMEDATAPIPVDVSPTSVRTSNRDPSSTNQPHFGKSVNDIEVQRVNLSLMISSDAVPLVANGGKQNLASERDSLVVQCSLTQQSGTDIGLVASSSISRKDLLPTHQIPLTPGQPDASPLSNKVAPMDESKMVVSEIPRVAQKEGMPKKPTGLVIAQPIVGQQIDSTLDDGLIQSRCTSDKDIIMQKTDISSNKTTGHSTELVSSAISSKESIDHLVSVLGKKECVPPSQDMGRSQISPSSVKTLASQNQIATIVTTSGVEYQTQQQHSIILMHQRQMFSTQESIQDLSPKGELRVASDMNISVLPSSPQKGSLDESHQVKEEIMTSKSPRNSVNVHHEGGLFTNEPPIESEVNSKTNVLKENKDQLIHDSSLTVLTPQATTTIQPAVKMLEPIKQMQLPDSLVVHAPSSDPVFSSVLSELDIPQLPTKRNREVKRDSLARTEDDIATFLFLGPKTTPPSIIKTDLLVDNRRDCQTTKLDETQILYTIDTNDKSAPDNDDVGFVTSPHLTTLDRSRNELPINPMLSKVQVTQAPMQKMHLDPHSSEQQDLSAGQMINLAFQPDDRKLLNDKASLNSGVMHVNFPKDPTHEVGLESFVPPALSDLQKSTKHFNLKNEGKCHSPVTKKSSPRRQSTASLSPRNSQPMENNQPVTPPLADMKKQISYDPSKPAIKARSSAASKGTPVTLTKERMSRNTGEFLSDKRETTSSLSPPPPSESRKSLKCVARSTERKLPVQNRLSIADSVQSTVGDAFVTSSVDVLNKELKLNRLQGPRVASSEGTSRTDEPPSSSHAKTSSSFLNEVNVENPVTAQPSIDLASGGSQFEQTPQLPCNASSKNRESSKYSKPLVNLSSESGASRSSCLGDSKETGKRISNSSGKKNQTKRMLSTNSPQFGSANIEPPHPVSSTIADPKIPRKRQHRHSRASYERHVDNQTRIDSLRSLGSHQSVEKCDLRPVVICSGQSSDLLEDELKTMTASIHGDLQPPADRSATKYASHNPVYPQDSLTRFDEVKRRLPKRSKPENEFSEPEKHRPSGTSARDGGRGGSGGAGRLSRIRKYRSSAQKSTLLTAMVSERVNSQLSSRGSSSPERESLNSMSSATILRSFAQPAPQERSLDSRLYGELMKCDQITDLRMYLQHEPVLQPARPVHSANAIGPLSGPKPQVNSLTITMPELVGMRERPAGDLMDVQDHFTATKITVSVDKPPRLLTISKVSLSKQMSEYTLEVDQQAGAEPASLSVEMNKIALEVDDLSKPSIIAHRTCSESNDHRNSFTEIATRVGDKLVINREAQTPETTSHNGRLVGQDKSKKPRTRHAKAQVSMPDGTSAQLSLGYGVEKVEKRCRGKSLPTALPSTAKCKKILVCQSPDQVNSQKSIPVHSLEETTSSECIENSKSKASQESTKSSSSSSQTHSSSRTGRQSSQGGKSEEVSLSICISDPSLQNSRSSTSMSGSFSRTHSLERRVRRAVRSCTADLDRKHCRGHSVHRRHKQPVSETHSRRQARRDTKKQRSSESLHSGSLSIDDVEEDWDDVIIDRPYSIRKLDRRCRSHGASSAEYDPSFSLTPNIIRLFRLSSSLKDLSVHLIYRELKTMLLHRLLWKRCALNGEVPETDSRSYHQ